MHAQWAADPTTRHRLRYWDGRTWTPWVADDQEAVLDDDPRPVASSAPEALGALAAVRPPSSGWYSDPTAPEARCYFDGAAWTEHTHSALATKASKVLVIASGGTLALAPLVWVGAVLTPTGPTGPSDGETELWAGVEAVAAVAFLVAFLAAIAAAIWAWTLHRTPREHRRRALRQTTQA